MSRNSAHSSAQITMTLPGSARSMTRTQQVRVAGYPALDRGVEVAVETTRRAGMRIPDAEGSRCQRRADDNHDCQAAARK